MKKWLKNWWFSILMFLFAVGLTLYVVIGCFVFANVDDFIYILLVINSNSSVLLLITVGAANMPKFEDEDVGIKRRLLLTGRNPGKMIVTLDEAIATMKQTNPTAKTIGFLSCKNGKQILKNHPRVVRKGRWFYYNFNGELIYIKIMKVEIPKGKTIKIARNYKIEPSTPFTFPWEIKRKDEE